ncbi:MAG: DNA/RNA helicase, partial [Actinobacteria bacterium]|nr:DNA/RNA helicase [Actinomycetota bacterium]
MSVRDSLLPHGYIHRHDLIDRGWRPDALRAAVRAEGLVTLRRQWIVHPSTPVPLRLAAASGGRVTCVTAAVTLGLWDPKTAGDPHIVLPPHSGSGCGGARVHRSFGVVASPPRRLIDPIENVLARVATCLPLEDALAVWESAVKKGLTTTHHLSTIAWRGSRARELAASTGRLSDSGLESLFTHRLRVAGIVMRQQVWIAGHNVDGLIGARLVVQIDGF